MTTSIQTDLKSILHALPHQDPRFEPWIDEGAGYQPFLEVARELKPHRVLEIGALLGYSLVAMLEGVPSATALWIDDEVYLPGSNRKCLANLNTYRECLRTQPGGVAGLYHWRSLYDYVKEPYSLQADLVHIDGDHSTLGKLRDLVITHELIQPRWILVDDLIKPSVWAGVNSFLRAVPDTYQEETIEPSRGLILLTRKS